MSILPLAEFQKKFEKATQKKIQKIRKKGNNIIKNIVKILESLEEEAQDMIKKSREELKEGVEVLAKKKAGYLDAVRSLEKFGENIIAAIANVKVPSEINHESITEFYKNLTENLIMLEKTKNKLDHKIHPYFIILRTRVKGLIKKLKDESNTLKKFIETDYTDAESIEKVQNELNTVKMLLEKLNDTKNQIASLEHKISLKADELENSRQKLVEMENRTEFQILTKTEKEIERLKTKTLSILNSIRKPLKKFLNLVTSGDATLKLEEKDILAKYINDPFNTFINEDSDASKLKILLLKMDILVREEKLGLERRLTKKLQKVLGSIVNQEVLKKLSSEYFNLLKEREKLLQKEEIQKVISKRESIKEISETINRLKMDLKVAQDSLQEIKERIETTKSIIEETTQKITGMPLKLSLEL
ncbi:MAG: hypothetical protein ACTSV7_12225 [Candidatus Baldrarchaeia archaeon]